MAGFVRGDVVVLRFPMTSQENFKSRPALVLASVKYGARDNYLLCMISATYDPLDVSSLPYEQADVTGGTIKKDGFIRPSYLFTAKREAITKRLGTMEASKVEKVLGAVRALVA